MRDDARGRLAGGTGNEWMDDRYNIAYARAHEKNDPADYWEYRELLKQMAPRPGSRVLDVGCNTGDWCNLLSERLDVIATGVDVNRDAIEIARSKYPGLDFQYKDLFDIEEGAYDMIYFMHIVEHLDKPIAALTKLRSLLVDGGRLVVVCPNRWAYLLKFGCWLIGERFCYDPTHATEFSPLSLARTVNAAGFHVLDTRTRPLGIPLLSRFSSHLYHSLPSAMLGGHIFLLAER